MKTETLQSCFGNNNDNIKLKMLNIDAAQNIGDLNMFTNLMLTYQCFISYGLNWQLVYT